MAFDEKLTARVRPLLNQLLDEQDGPTPEVIERKMFGGLAFMVGDVLRIGVMQDDLMIRCDPHRMASLLTRAGARPMDFTGRPMTGFLFVGGSGTDSAPSLTEWLRYALEAPTPVKRRRAPARPGQIRASGRRRSPRPSDLS